MNTFIKSKHTICSALIIAALIGSHVNRATAADDPKLLAKAKVTKEQAEKMALDKVPGGTIKEGEIEQENGKLIWSFDIATKGTKDITEVNIDAMTGAVIAVDVEKAKDEAAEAKKEKEEAKAKAKEAKLLKKAKISKEEAEKIALAKVPNGTIKEGELEEEKHKLIWSFDIATPDSKNITEVNVDAKTGNIIAVDVETPDKEAKEAKDEAKEKKGKKVEKDDEDEKDEKK
jgi:uncharacterized membrane protein YkoI